MSRTHRFAQVTLVLAALLLGACEIPHRTLAVRNLPAITMRFIYPWNGEAFTLPDRIELEASATVRSDDSIPTGITHWIFYANHQQVSTCCSDSGQNPGSGRPLRAYWTPTEPGEYLLQAAAFQASGAYAVTAPVRVCVLPASAAGRLTGQPYLGPCDAYPTVPSTWTPAPVTPGTPHGGVLLYYPPPSTDTSTPTETATATFWPLIIVGAGRPVTSTFTPTSTATATATATPTATGCPPGTYAGANGGCIAVQFSPTTKAVNACHAFGDQKTCEANACSWNMLKNVCR